MAASLAFLNIAELSGLLERREVSPVEATRDVLDRIDRLDKRLNSYLTVVREQALAAAGAAEKMIQAGVYLGPLHGVPIGLKDFFYTKGIKTTVGAKILDDHVPEFDGTVAGRLKKAGAILVGKQNTDEFGLGITTENFHYGPTHNPWDLDRVPGGSSGGSAAALAAGLCNGAIGGDTGGSIRVPASLCGIVGLKPTYGRVSRWGEEGLVWSLDTAGPMARTVEDVAILLGAIAGWDPRDPTTSHVPVPDYRGALHGGVKGLRLGLPREYFGERVDPEVQAAVSRAVRALEGLGATVSEVAWPHIRFGLPVHLTILLSCAAAYHRKRVHEQAEGISKEVRTFIEMGKFVMATDYLKAQQIQSLIIREYYQALSFVDIMVTPTTPITAPKIGERWAGVRGEQEGTPTWHSLYRFTFPFNLCYAPTISVPCGFSKAGLPIGLQLSGRPFEEVTVLRAAHAYQSETSWHTKRPPIG
jgi:aspartyl-tRNA(Asn)/glutamyl-tRNA(Gln) amidotransferase subunit A